MEYRKLGSSDLDVSVVGLGTNNFGGRITDLAQSARVIDASIDAGVNFIDTANGYGGGQSEVHIGEALKGKRDKVILATKFNLFGRDGQSVRDRINQEIDLSLGKLQTDYIDLYQIHWPSDTASHEQVLEPMNDLVKQGKVRHIGECNYSGWRHAQSDAVSAVMGFAPFVSSQNYYNVLRREIELELLPFCTANNVGVLPYFPLAGGWLTGKYNPSAGIPDGARRMVGQLQGDARARAQLDQLDSFAKDKGHSVLDLAFSWLLAHPAVSSVIAGAMTAEQVSTNAASADWQMSREERNAIDEMATWDGQDEKVEGYGPGQPPVAK